MIPMLPPIQVVIQEVVTQEEYSVIEQINAFRVENGLKTTKISPETCKFARQRLTEVQTDWSHDGFYKARKAHFENLGKNGVVSNIVPAWIKSVSHRKNLLSSMKSMCVKSINGYWVMEGNL